MYCGGMTFCPKYPLELFLLPPRLDPKREVYNIACLKELSHFSCNRMQRIFIWQDSALLSPCAAENCLPLTFLVGERQGLN